ncbi:hypothetical protein RI367_008587 [Sorochytrium milnesiophthora]
MPTAVQPQELQQDGSVDIKATVRSVSTYEDECQYWSQVASSAADTKQRDEATEYRDILQSARKDFLTLSSASVNDILALIDKTQQILQELWLPSFAADTSVPRGFPQERMQGLLDTLTGVMVKAAEEQLESLEQQADRSPEETTPSFWMRDFKDVEGALDNAVSILAAWQQTLAQLSTQVWPSSSSQAKKTANRSSSTGIIRQWVGPMYNGQELTLSRERLIRSIRSVSHAMMSILDTEVAQHFPPSKMFAMFSAWPPSTALKLDQTTWTAAVAQHDRAVQSIEKHAVASLKRELVELQSSPYQFMRQMLRYRELVSRPNIKQGIVSEREALMNCMIGNLQAIRAQLSGMKHLAIESIGISQSIVWCRAAAAKIAEMDDIVMDLMDDLPNAQSFMHQSMEVRSALETLERDQLAEWVSNVEDTLSSTANDAQGKTDLMTLDYTSGKLLVNYSEQIVGLVREVRYLVSLGSPVPAKVQRACEEANKTQRYAVLLQQVAHFYNTVDQQMLPPQQAMLLPFALAFENLVRQPNGEMPMDWSNASLVESYIARLQECVRLLTAENRKLRKFHALIGERVASLFDTSLLRHQSRWKEELQQTRAIFNTVESQGYKAETMQVWKLHWDHQLYRALEFQYQLGLESLHESLPEMQVELIVKNQVLQFRPPYEEIRAKYYREMKRFITIPTVFRGFSETAIFAAILENSASSLLEVYRRAEELFQNVARASDTFKDWVMLASVDLAAYAEEMLSQTADWEHNFKAIKKRGKDLELLPTSLQVDCIVVSTLPVKSTIDDLLQRLFDALVSSLRKSIRKHLSTVEQYIASGTELLTQRPDSLEAIGRANHEHEALKQSKESIKGHFVDAEAKNKLLRAVVGSGVDLSATLAEWERFDTLMDSHHLMIQDQFEQLKLSIDQRIGTVMQQVGSVCQRWQQLRSVAFTEEALRNIDRQMEQLAEREREILDVRDNFDKLCTDCDQFQVPRPSGAQLQEVMADCASVKERWTLLKEFAAELDAVLSSNWIAFRSRLSSFEELLTKWSQLARKDLKSPTNGLIMQQVDLYSRLMPLMKLLRGEYWAQQHWVEFFRLVHQPTVPVADITVRDILAAGDTALLPNAPAIAAIDERARGEIVIRDALQELEVWSMSANFTLAPHTTSKGTTLSTIKEWKEVMTQIGDNQSVLQSLKESPYYKTFQDKAQSWDAKLAAVSSLVVDLNVMQRKWVYLEPIFSSGALSTDKSRFRKVEDLFLGIMSRVQGDPRILSLVQFVSGADELKNACDQLERCQRALYDYLESKRELFARFYFLGDDDLLEILGQSHNPRIIQNHLKKLFAGVDAAVFNGDMTQILAVQSAEGERLSLHQPVDIANTDVENWLQTLSSQMRITLQLQLAQCLAQTDVHQYPQMILDLAQQIKFTSLVEAAMPDKRLPDVLAQLQAYLAQLTQYKFDATAGEQEVRVMHCKVKSLTLELVHEISVVEDLIDRKVASTDDWQWQRQLRFYLNSDNLCIIRMAGSEFNYTYEYQGNPEKLVHTPLTDKCYLVLTNAIANGFGGNPYGPAGTGKTESVKALGYLFGRQVLVFNCDEALDYQSMNRILFGIVRCGAWGCFDEFNRLDSGVLSAISQQIQAIQLGLKTGEQEVRFSDKNAPLDRNTAVYVTLNPAGKRYGGRQRLPDNLKQLFRSIAMSVPDNELIAEIVLFSEGFQSAKDLGRKIVRVYDMSRLLLSLQQQYDWGLRPLKAILRSAGAALKSSGKGDAAHEQRCVLQSLQVNTLSKLTVTDRTLFNRIVQDVFLGGDVTAAASDLRQSIEQAFAQLQLIFDADQADKVEQLHQSCLQRTGVVLLGPSGTGKSVVLRVLLQVWKQLSLETKLVAVNPKAVDKATLLGSMDPETREWHDGILTKSSRTLMRDMTSTSRCVFLCDGDVDPEWIEALNSTLDDNKLLTLPNGERIQFDSRVNFVFETHSIQFASPATVSRMAVVYFSDNALSEQLLGRAWALHDAERQAERQQWIDAVFCRLLPTFFDQHKTPMPASRSGIVQNVLAQVWQADSKLMFVFNLFQALSSMVPESAAAKLATEASRLSGVNDIDGRPLHEVVYSFEDGGAFKVLDSSSANLQQVQDASGSQTLVLTARMERYVGRVSSLLARGTSFALVGPSASSKDLVLRCCFSRSLGTVVTVSCNPSTSSKDVVGALMSGGMLVSSSSGPVLKAKSGDRLVLYIKDLDVARADKYGSSSVVSLLHQLITHRGYFGADLEWVHVESLVIVLSANSSRLSTQNISFRLTSALAQVLVERPSRAELLQVTNALLSSRMATYASEHGLGLDSELWQHPQKTLRLCETLAKAFQAATTACAAVGIEMTIRSLALLLEELPRYLSGAGDLQLELDVIRRVAGHLFAAPLPTSKEKKALQLQISGIIEGDWQMRLPDDSTTARLFSSCSEPGRCVSLASADYTQLVRTALQSLEDTYGSLNVQLSDEVLEQISRIETHLSSPGRSLILIMAPGMQRIETALVALQMLKMEVRSLTIGAASNFKSLANDFKGIFSACGLQQQRVTLVIEEQHIFVPEALQLLSDVLAMGFVTSLYAPEELEALLVNVKEEHAQTLFPGSVLDFFKMRVRQHLHVVVATDARSQLFEVISSQAPAIMRASHQVRLDKWSSISSRCITAAELNASAATLPTAVMDQVHQLGGAIHDTVHDYQVSPVHTLRFVQTFGALYRQRHHALVDRHRFLSDGLGKLEESAAYVDKLNREADVQSKELAQKQHDADIALQSITEAMAKAAEQRQETEALSTSLQAEEVRIVQQQASIQAELNDVEPVLKAAKSAVGEIQSGNIAEVRALRAPPAAVRDVLEGVLVLLGVGDTSWTNMKAFLGKRGFKEEVMSFDARNIAPETRGKVEALMRQKPDSFEEASVKRSSVAAAPLATWVRANVQFSTVFERVKPLEKNLAKITQTLEASRTRLAELNTALANLDQTVAALKNEFGDKTREAEVLKNSLARTVETIGQAKQLLENLAGERTRWRTQVDDLVQQLERLPLMLVLASAVITYQGQLLGHRRSDLLEQWKTACGDVTDFDFLSVVSSETERLGWLAQGLPGDALSVANAVILSAPQTVRIVVDAVGQGVQWLKSVLTERKAEIVPNDRNAFKAIELALRFGKTILVYDVDVIDPWLFPILRGEIRKQGARSLVLLGDKLVDVGSGFQLYLVLRDPNFSMPIELSGYAAFVRFSATMEGLTDQLSNLCMQVKRPDLQQRKFQLIEQEEKLKLDMSGLESQLLSELVKSEGNILENQSLIHFLRATKDKVSAATAALQQSTQLKQDIEQQSAAFQPLAQMGSRLFAVLDTLKEVNHMYQFSFRSFEQLFRTVLQGDPGSQLAAENSNNAIAALLSQLKRRVLDNVMLALTKKDYQLFLMQFSMATATNAGTNTSEWDAVLQLRPIVEDESKPAPAWVPPTKKTAYLALIRLLPAAVAADMAQDASQWKAWATHATPEAVFPAAVQKQLSPLHRLLMISYLRPDRFSSTVDGYIHETVNMEIATTWSLAQTYKTETSASQPIVLIANPGSDPTQELTTMAQAVLSGTGQQLTTLAMGSLETQQAMDCVLAAAERGNWLYLQNVHLCLQWLPTLHSKLGSLTPHPMFRLWLSTEQMSGFPARLLEDSLKVMFEAPPGLRENLSTTLSQWKQDTGTRESVLSCQTRFAMSWFHGVVQERRTFVPQAWNTYYEFSLADFSSSVELLLRYLQQDTVRWPVVCGLLAGAVYGGRIDIKQDQEKLRILLESCFNEHVFTTGGRAPQRKLGRAVALPSSTSKQDYLALVSQVTNNDILPYLVLPANVDGVLQQSMREYTLGQLRRLLHLQQHRVNAGDGAAAKQALQGLLNTWAKEYRNSRELIEQVSASLKQAAAADRSDGNVAWINSLRASETPQRWRSFWEGPDDVSLFMQQLCLKHKAVYSLLGAAQAKSLLSQPVRLSDVIDPGRFLAAFRQAAARASACSVDSLSLMTSWQETGVPAGTLCVKVDGLSIQGARFDGMQLSEVVATDPVIMPAPLCYLWWRSAGSGKAAGDPKTQLPIPLFTNPSREQSVATLDLPCPASEQERFTLYGVALFIESA